MIQILLIHFSGYILLVTGYETKMKKPYEDSILAAQRLLQTTHDVGHDIGHARRVAHDVRLIGRQVGYEDIDLLEVCAWWHDVGRLYNPNHEVLSAKLMSRDLKKRGIGYKTRRQAYKAVYRHRLTMHPKTVQGKIIKDADKLDFLSVERWNSREATGERLKNQKNLARLPYVRQHLYFGVSRQLFDERLGGFAENLEQPSRKLSSQRLTAQPA